MNLGSVRWRLCRLQQALWQQQARVQDPPESRERPFPRSARKRGFPGSLPSPAAGAAFRHFCSPEEVAVEPAAVLDLPAAVGAAAAGPFSQQQSLQQQCSGQLAGLPAVVARPAGQPLRGALVAVGPAVMMGLLRAWLPLIGAALLLHGVQRLLSAPRP